MIKSELIDVISKQQLHLSEKDIASSINAIIEQMGATLSANERIEIRGFGSFSLHYRPPRKAHNPKTGHKLITEPKYAVHFKPGKDMRERVNAAQHLPIRDADINAGYVDDED